MACSGTALLYMLPACILISTVTKITIWDGTVMGLSELINIIFLTVLTV
jgi:hypothetical protein